LPPRLGAGVPARRDDGQRREFETVHALLRVDKPEHDERFLVRPGLTGLWQVSGRSEIGFLGMLDLDVEYARSSSPGLDARILVRTLLAVIRGKAA